MWNTFYHTEGLEARVRNQVQRARTEDDVFRCVDWLYGGIAVPERLEPLAD